MQEEVRKQYSSSDSQRRALSTQALSLIIPKTMKLVFVSSTFKHAVLRSKDKTVWF